MIPTSPKTRAAFLLALVALILLAYHGVSSHDFVYLDDGAYLFQNAWTAQGLTLESVLHHLTHTTGGQYMPVTMISYLPIVSLFGDSAPPQLWFNVLVHAANCLLVVWVLHKYTGRFWPSAVVAFFLALHPVHVESVAWATERKDVLFMFFGLLTLGSYAGYARNPTPIRYLLTLLLFSLSLLSKSMLVTMPALLILLDIWPLGRVPRLWSNPPANTPASLTEAQTKAQPTSLQRLLVEKIPFALLSAAMAYITVKSTGGTGGVASADSLPYDLRIALALTGYINYLATLVYPVDLCGLYPIPRYFDKSTVLIHAVALLAITAAALWQFKKRPYLLIGWLWYLGTLAPVSGIMQAGNQSRADRFVYWPFLGLYIAIIWLAFDLFSKTSLTSRTQDAGHKTQDDASVPSSTPANLPTPLLILLIVLAPLLGVLTYRQVATWANSEVFFKHIIAVTTQNPQAHSALATYFVDQKRIPEAREQFRQVLQIDPTDASALTALAELAVQENRIAEAMELVQQVLALAGKPGEAHANAAFLLLQFGQPQQALALIQQCLQNKPNNLVVKTNAGVIFVAAGTPEQKTQGLALLESALASSPGDPGILTNLGSAYANLGRFDEAQVFFTRAIESKPNDMRAYPQLALLYKLTGHPDRARAVYRAGLAIDPHDAACLRGLNQLDNP